MHNVVAGIQSAAEEYPFLRPKLYIYIGSRRFVHQIKNKHKKSPQTSAGYGRKLILQLLLQLTVV